MDGTQLGILEHVHQEGLGGLLESLDCLALPAKFASTGTAVHADFAHLSAVSDESLWAERREERFAGRGGTNQAHEGKLAKQQLRVALVLSNLAQGHGSGAITSLVLYGNRITGCGTMRLASCQGKVDGAKEEDEGQWKRMFTLDVSRTAAPVCGRSIGVPGAEGHDSERERLNSLTRPFLLLLFPGSW